MFFIIITQVNLQYTELNKTDCLWEEYLYDESVLAGEPCACSPSWFPPGALSVTERLLSAAGDKNIYNILTEQSASWLFSY